MFSKNIILLTFIFLSSVLCMDSSYQGYYDKELADNHLLGEQFYVEI
ncbi:hypothetical protein [Bacillus sp. SN10]|nr:hypothetical protein [Bacillus sp. SN10]